MGQNNQIFISASGADADAAKALFKALKRFRVPPLLNVPRPYQPFKSFRALFLHDEEDPRQSTLTGPIVEQIQRSSTMMVVCSPHTAVSKWIQAEIREFYAHHPRGRVIPIVMDGEPEPELAIEAYVKPCLPEGLKHSDAQYWVDARECDWEYAAPVAAMAALLGVRIEELVQHLSRRAETTRKRSVAAVVVAMTTVGLAVLWTFRSPFQEWTGIQVPGFSENPGALAERGEEIYSGDESLIPPGPVAFEAVVPSPHLTPATANSAKTNSVLVPVESPEAIELALAAWLDRAESCLPDQTRDARFWLDTCEAKLDLEGPRELVKSRYRFHAISAALAKNLGEEEAANRHLLNAIDRWTEIPIENPVGQEREAFEILATLAPNEEWRESALRLVIWISQLKGDKNRVLARAQNFIAFASRFPFLVEPVDAWLAGAVSRMTPPAKDALELGGRFAILRSKLAEGVGDLEGARKLLQEGRLNLASANQGVSPVAAGLAAQMGVRQILLRDRFDRMRTAEELDGAIPLLQEGMIDEEWTGWFGADLAAAWSIRGDLYLADDVFQTASQAYGFALEHLPSEAEVGSVLLKMGCAYRYAGLHREAWEAFSMAQTLLNDESEIHDRITAFLGVSLAAGQTKTASDAEKLLAQANVLMTSAKPPYQLPTYWRESLDQINQAEVGTALVPDESAELSRLQQHLQAVEHDFEKNSVADLEALRGLHLALERLAVSQLNGN